MDKSQINTVRRMIGLNCETWNVTFNEHSDHFILMFSASNKAGKKVSGLLSTNYELNVFRWKKSNEYFTVIEKKK